MLFDGLLTVRLTIGCGMNSFDLIRCSLIDCQTSVLDELVLSDWPYNFVESGDSPQVVPIGRVLTSSTNIS